MFRVALVTAVLKPVVQPTLGRLVNGTASQRASGLVTSARKKCTTALRYYKLQNFKKNVEDFRSVVFVLYGSARGTGRKYHGKTFAIKSEDADVSL